MATFTFVPFVICAFLLGLAFSIFFSGALDPRLAIRRGAVIALLGVLITVVFVAVEGTVQSQVALRFDLPSQTGAIVAGTIAAIVFSPLHKRVEHGVDGIVERFMPVREFMDGERVSTTVCCVNLSGQAELSRRDPAAAQVHAALLQKCAASAVEDHGGRLSKMPVGGPLLRCDSPTVAVASLRTIMREYAIGTQTLRIAPLPLCAGIHEGEVMLSPDRGMVGPGVDLATRLCSLAGDGQALVSESCLSRIGVESVRPVGGLSFKGQSEPVTAFAIRLDDPR